MSKLILFDLDGVITDEAAYWDAAGLTLHELLYSPRYWNLSTNHLGTEQPYYPVTSSERSRRISRILLPETEILTLKARAINSDWDVCYAAVCLHLIDLLVLLPNLSSLLPLRPWDADWLAAFRGELASTKNQKVPKVLSSYLSGAGVSFISARLLTSPLVRDYVGLELINRFDIYASQMLGHSIEGAFSRHSPFWTFCQDIFQEWYLGDELYIQTYGRAPAQTGKPGCIYFEQPLLPLEQVRTTLKVLCQQGYTLGIATGRPHQEALVPLKMYGLHQYFDEQHIATYDDVERAEAILRATGDQTLLNKPHPYLFLLAAKRTHPFTGAEAKAMHHAGFVVVGDSTSDILGGQAADALTIAVLTGAHTPEARTRLAHSTPDFTIDDVTQLPALLEHLDVFQ